MYKRIKSIGMYNFRFLFLILNWVFRTMEENYYRIENRLMSGVQEILVCNSQYTRHYSVMSVLELLGEVIVILTDE